MVESDKEFWELWNLDQKQERLEFFKDVEVEDGPAVLELDEPPLSWLYEVSFMPESITVDFCPRQGGYLVISIPFDKLVTRFLDYLGRDQGSDDEETRALAIKDKDLAIKTLNDAIRRINDWT